jgi:hypothetical protein
MTILLHRFSATVCFCIQDMNTDKECHAVLMYAVVGIRIKLFSPINHNFYHFR